MIKKAMALGALAAMGLIAVGCSGSESHNASWQAGYDRAIGDQQLAGIVGSGYCDRYFPQGSRYNYDDWMAGCQAAMKKIPMR